LNIESWRKQLAVVSQEAFIFNDTVRANLKFAKVDATDAEIFQAAHLAQAHDFITALPQGYDTLLGDRGVRLSGGQQQRISIARAVLANPQLLILDEATSELDSETERAIQVAVEQYGRGRTVFVIAHRLSTIRRADSILVLAEGRVAEQGTHEELMRKGGQYWQLVQGQNLAEEGAGEGEDRDEM
jgi:ABC-type multidrug transport system fused ATPase/permease subunit